MKNKVKDLMKDMNKSFVDQIVDVTNKVSRYFNKIRNEEVIPTNDSIHPQMDRKSGKEVLDSLKQLTADLKKQAIEKGLRNLEEKRVIRDMLGRKYVFAKWYNKWYYRIKYKRSVTEYMLCAGEQYYLENEFCNILKPFENIEDEAMSTELTRQTKEERTYYANIVRTRGTTEAEICSFIFLTREDADNHRDNLATNLSFQFVETISFDSTKDYR